MKLCLIIPFFCFYVCVSFAQNVGRDGISQESINDQNIDAPAYQKMDSIQTAFYQRADSIKIVYKQRFKGLDSTHLRLSYRLDSLTTIERPRSKLLSGNLLDSVQSPITTRMDSLKAQTSLQQIRNSLDSIHQLQRGTVAELNDAMQSLKDKTVGKLSDINMPPQLSGKLTEASSQINAFRLPSDDLNIPSMQGAGDFNIPELNNLSLPSLQGAGIDNVGKLSEGGLGAIPDMAGSVPEYAADVQQISSGNLSDVKALPETAEAKAEELSGINEVKDQTQVLDKYKDMGNKMQNPDSLKEAAVQEVKQVAVNHFAGKEEQLKEAMETLSKYKSKYSSLNSISEITKRRPNEMKGKPLIERIIPGIAMQVQRKGEDLLVDFSPYAGFRFTGRITTGLGWNQRVAYSVDNNVFNPSARIFGPRMFGEYKLWKGFSPRAEVEVMNTLTPVLTRTPTVDPPNREWVWGAFVGIKKEYKFIKNVKGTALVMIRLFNPQYKSHYADVVNVRFGFEFPMRKSKKANP